MGPWCGTIGAVTPTDPTETPRFRQIAERVLDALLESAPEEATQLGDHRFDDRFADLSEQGVRERASVLHEALSALDEVDDTVLGDGDGVDLEILRTVVARELWSATQLRPHERDPLRHLPGEGIYPLLVREIGEPGDRLRALAARLDAVPARLETARRVLHDMARVHVETAIGQAQGLIGMLDDELPALLAKEPALAGEVGAARGVAVRALERHVAWLREQLPEATADPRLGAENYAARLWYTLDTEITPDALLTRAECDLQAVEEQIAEFASRLDRRPVYAGQVRAVLGRLAAEEPVDDTTILGLCERTLDRLTARVRELDLVTVPDVPVRIAVMPPSRRGVAVAYCDPPGPLEPPAAQGPGPTLFAVSPTPPDWSPERVASFYREYNGHMLRTLVAHEAMPGHLLQLAHAAGYRAGTRVRAATLSQVFVEGWAVYAEELLAQAGLGGSAAEDDALRVQQLKMQLRSTINAILDVRVHARGMTEDEALTLMRERGHQEEGEAVGKWRRALLTSAQLSTYYVGYHAVRTVVDDLHSAEPFTGRRDVHDRVLSFGSPPPRHLRTLLGLA